MMKMEICRTLRCLVVISVGLLTGALLSACSAMPDYSQLYEKDMTTIQSKASVPDDWTKYQSGIPSQHETINQASEIVYGTTTQAKTIDISTAQEKTQPAEEKTGMLETTATKATFPVSKFIPTSTSSPTSNTTQEQQIVTSLPKGFVPIGKLNPN